MEDESFRFSDLPDKSKIRLLTDAHNTLIGKNRAYEIENLSLLDENKRLLMKMAQPTETEVDKLRKVLEILNGKISRQNKIIAEFRKSPPKKSAHWMKLFLEDNNLLEKFEDWNDELHKYLELIYAE